MTVTPTTSRRSDRLAAMSMVTENPFMGPRYGEIQTYTFGAEDRIVRVKSFDRKQCLAALALPDLQKTVARAVERRLRQIGRDQA